MLFFKKKEEKKKVEVCECATTSEPKEEAVAKEEPACCCCGGSCKESTTSVNSVKVLGSGCKRCHELFENAKQAVANAGINAKVEYITDVSVAMQYGVMSMPALIVNEKVVSMGRVLKSEEIQKLL